MLGGSPDKRLTAPGGIKQSGYGREGGSMAIKDYLNVKYTHMGIKG
jgi:succinate-semialdehyde dehydrogenase/glutarate-semialdehyde dehydrogenase